MDSLERWLEYGLELVANPKIGTLPTRMYVYDKILSESGYDAECKKLRTTKGIVTIERVLQLLSNNKQTAHADFDKQMKIEIGKRKAEPMNKYTVAFPLPFRFPPFSKLNSKDVIEGNPIIVGDFPTFHSSFLQNLQTQNLKEIGLSNNLSQIIPLIRDSRIVLCESYARDELFAFLDTSISCKQWAALLCYSQASIIDVKYPPLPFTPIRLPKFGMVFQKNQYVRSFGGNYPIPNEPHHGVFKLDRFYDVMKKVENLPELKVKEIVREALAIYSEAVCDTDQNYAFLKFWVGLELMVKLRSNLPDDKIAGRIKHMFFLEKPKAFDPQVESLLRKRNLILHEGELGTVQWYDIIFAKQLYEEILLQLMKFCNNSYDVDWIETYYDFANDQADVLPERLKAIEFLIKQKKS